MAGIFSLPASLLVWENWVSTMLAVESFYAEWRYPQNIALGAWGLLLFLATVWFSRGDMDMLMASGAFISPHRFFYNLLAVVFSWMTLSSNWPGSWGWWLGRGFVPWVWLNLAAMRNPKWRLRR